jgi:anti-sigma regulatory factor (Ser/Thr protein kinase)
MAHHRFSFESRPREVVAALDRIESVLLGQGLAAEVAQELRLVAEEGLTNILRYAYAVEGEGRIEVALTMDEAQVRLVLRDRGRPFNPLAEPPPALEAPPAERPLGGLGIHLIRSLTDEQSYAREGAENVLVLLRRREGP